MKNKELIAKLQEMDPELEVRTYDVDYGYEEPDPVIIEDDHPRPCRPLGKFISL